ncbi:MAG: protein jag [Chloroflexi bacterium]|nr:protein jag [Chloroflexota bacterium]
MSDLENEKSVDVSAKTVEEAIEQGLQALGVSRDVVEVDIVKEASRGILGLGATDAVVRLTVRDSSPSPAATLEQADLAEEADESKVVLQVGREVLTKLLDSMGLEAEVVEGEAGTSFDEAPPVVLDIVGRDLGLLIGRRGETLQALHFLTRLIVGRRLGRRVNLAVDVEGYKARRERALMEMAHRMASQVKQDKRSFVFEPMPANERRILHLTLRDDPDVSTQSIGEGNRRKVMVIPKT